MKVLGINFSNDAAAALLVDGKIVGAVQEERLSRIKHDSSFPAKAVRWVLKEAGLQLSDIDAVGFFWNPGIHAEAGNARMTAVPRDHKDAKKLDAILRKRKGGVSFDASRRWSWTM